MLRYNLVSDNQKLITALTVFMVLSTLDGALTLWGLSLGIIEEANPIMELVIARSIVGFMAIKLSLPIMLGAVCWRIRRTSRKLVTYSLRMILVIYTLVNMLHIYWIFVKG